MNTSSKPSRAAIEKLIRAFLAQHPNSPTLLVAQSVWGELRSQTRNVYVDSWLWIRDQMEVLAGTGALRRDGQVWSLA